MSLKVSLEKACFPKVGISPSSVQTQKTLVSACVMQGYIKTATVDETMLCRILPLIVTNSGALVRV